MAAAAGSSTVVSQWMSSGTVLAWTLRTFRSPKQVPLIFVWKNEKRKPSSFVPALFQRIISEKKASPWAADLSGCACSITARSPHVIAWFPVVASHGLITSPVDMLLLMFLLPTSIYSSLFPLRQYLYCRFPEETSPGENDLCRSRTPWTNWSRRMPLGRHWNSNRQWN